MTSVFIKTLGCKVNAFDSHAISYQLKEKGFALRDSAAAAGVVIINSCSVTAKAEKEALYYARKFRRENPSSLVVITGCYAQTDSGTISKHPEIDFIVPNAQKSELVPLLVERLRRGTGKMPQGVQTVTANRQSHFKLAQTLTDHVVSTATRKYVKVQDGCNGFCSYCIIPYARGASVSVPMQQVIEQVEALTAVGDCEIVLTGVHLGDYGADMAKRVSFSSLLMRLFALPQLTRLRISSLEPSELSDELLAVLQLNAAKFCPHFHLPLQSASDKILRQMRRKYTIAQYLARLQAARKIFPTATFGADVICGFPGEEEEDHQATLEFGQRAKLNYLHVFPYSKRPNTLALRLAGHLPATVIKERQVQLTEFSRRLREAHYRKFIGQRLQVLWEQGKPRMGGYSRNYLRVTAPYRADFLKRETTVQIAALCHDGTLQGCVDTAI